MTALGLGYRRPERAGALGVVHISEFDGRPEHEPDGGEADAEADGMRRRGEHSRAIANTGAGGFMFAGMHGMAMGMGMRVR